MAAREKKRPTFAEVWEQACREGKAPVTRSTALDPRGCPRYEHKLMTGESSVRSDGDFEQQARNYRAAREQQRLVRQQVQLILQAHGVLVIQFVTYYNFAARVGALVRDFGGETLRQWVELTVSDWLRRGCEEAVLREILDGVFRMGEEEG